VYLSCSSPPGGYDAVYIKDDNVVCFVQITHSKTHALKLRHMALFLHNLTNPNPDKKWKVEILFAVPSKTCFTLPKSKDITGSLSKWKWNMEQDMRVIVFHDRDSSEKLFAEKGEERLLVENAQLRKKNKSLMEELAEFRGETSRKKRKQHDEYDSPEKVIKKKRAAGNRGRRSIRQYPEHSHDHDHSPTNNHLQTQLPS